MSCHHGHDHVHHHHANLEVKVSNNFTKCYFWDWEVSWKLCLKVCTYGKVKKAEKLQTLQSLRSHVENQCHQFLWPWVIFRRKWHRSPCLWQKLECRPAGMIKKNVLLFNYYTSKEGFWFFFQLPWVPWGKILKTISETQKYSTAVFLARLLVY